VESLTEWEGEFDVPSRRWPGPCGCPASGPGSARQLLEARIDKEAMLDQVVGERCRAKYSEAVYDRGRPPARQPEIRSQEGVRRGPRIHRRVDVRPEIELPTGRAEITFDRSR